MFMNIITIDIETRSDRDITKCGVYAYADSPHFDILLFAYSVDGGPVKVIDTASGEKIPEEIIAALVSRDTVKQAFNVNFERVCLSVYLKRHYPDFLQDRYISPEGWQCTMIHCRYLGLPSSLAEAGAVIGVEQQKMTEGKALIRYFCIPYSNENGIPLFHSPEDAPEKWKAFKEYN